MDEEIKNVEESASQQVNNEGASVMDQLKDMFDQATSGEGNVFDKLKGMLEGKEGEAGVLDQLKEMFDKGTDAAGQMSEDFLAKAKQMFETREGEPSLLDKAKDMLGDGMIAAGNMIDKANEYVEQGKTAAGQMAQDIEKKAKETFDKDGDGSVLDDAQDALGDVADAAGKVVDKVQDFLKNAFGGAKDQNNEGQA